MSLHPGLLPATAWLGSLLSFLSPRTAPGGGSRVLQPAACCHHPRPHESQTATPFPPREVSCSAWEPPSLRPGLQVAHHSANAS